MTLGIWWWEFVNMEEDDPPQVFQWQLPEGAPDPEPAGVQPLLNGFHEDHEDELVGALHAACRICWI